jgi:hypothetical protein
MHCAVHPEIEACGPCAVCFKNLCDACATFDLESKGSRSPCCERCGRSQENDSDALSSGLLALIAVGYLAALAIGVSVFKAQPFVGGLAAVVAIGLGRAMQMLVKTPTAMRRLSAARR